MPPKTPAPRGGGKTAGPRRKGGRARATTALLTKEHRLGLTTSDQMRAYWDPACHDTAPALRTSFGNFTTVNALTRLRISTSTTLDSWVVMRWSSDDFMGFRWQAPQSTPGGPGQAVFKMMNTYLTGSYPVALRPLRMGIRLMNTTPVLNRGGLVYCTQIDAPFNLATESLATSGSQVTWDAGTMATLQALVEGGFDTMELSVEDTAKGVSIVSCPSSYPRYNSYHDYDGSSDPFNLFLSPSDCATRLMGQSPPATYPVTLSTISTLEAPDDSVMAVPPMRTIILLFKPTTVANDYLIEFRRQDGVRYPANSLGHAFHMTHDPCTADHETSVMKSVQKLTATSGGGFSLVDTIDKVATIANGVSTAAAYAGRARAALSLLSRLV